MTTRKSPQTQRVAEFEWVPIAQLVPWKLNPRKNEDTIPMVMRSIERHGWGRPIVANRHKGLEGEIVIGHTALEAAKRLGKGEVPVRWVDLPAKRAHALALADNKLGEQSKWDSDKLGQLVGSAELEPEDWLSSGFEEKEIKALMFAPWPGADGRARGAGSDLTFSVIVECEDEGQQTELLQRFEDEGLSCKPWVG